MNSSKMRGIIPAYAGSTGLQHLLHQFSDGSSPHTRGAPPICPDVDGWVRDHPRIRGEHRRGNERRRNEDGSSPHTRGAHLRQHGTGVDPGIIPAYAGSTVFAYPTSIQDGDHPRIRGEHFDLVGGGADDGGSSPHTRGARGRQLPGRSAARIIPAYAGSTCRLSH